MKRRNRKYEGMRDKNTRKRERFEEQEKRKF